MSANSHPHKHTERLPSSQTPVARHIPDGMFAIQILGTPARGASLGWICWRGESGKGTMWRGRVLACRGRISQLRARSRRGWVSFARSWGSRETVTCPPSDVHTSDRHGVLRALLRRNCEIRREWLDVAMLGLWAVT